jgi:phage anti-repressor protein
VASLLQRQRRAEWVAAGAGGAKGEGAAQVVQQRRGQGGAAQCLGLVPAVLADGRQVPSISARAVWEWLGCPDAKFRQWWARAFKRHNLLEGKDFIGRLKTEPTKRGRGGDRVSKDYLLTVDTAIRICACDPSPKGRTLLDELIAVRKKIEAGDPALATYVNQRVLEVHGEDHGITPLSWRTSKSMERHLLFINVRRLRCRESR